jgi:hypothetical protein
VAPSGQSAAAPDAYSATLEGWALACGEAGGLHNGAQGGLRVAFCGRVSTEDWQDPVTSQVESLIEDCADIARDLCQPEPADVANAYRKLGLRLT